MPMYNSANEPLFDRYGDDHPALRFIYLLYKFRSDCAGCELAWPGQENNAVDREWYSRSMNRVYQLSGVIYGHFCFDPVLTYWLDHPDEVTDQERTELKRIAEARELFEECEAVDTLDGDGRVGEIIRRGREVLDAWERSIGLRLTEINATGKMA